MQANDYLGKQLSDSITRFSRQKQPLTSEQLSLAQKVWLAFRKPTPEDWASLLGSELAPLPYLESSLQRMLEELPSHSSGISRTQYQILRLIDRGISEPKKLFTESQKNGRSHLSRRLEFFQPLVKAKQWPSAFDRWLGRA